MNSLPISKQTQDRVKLAKKYIEDKYQTLLTQEKEQKQNWNKILRLMTMNKIPQSQKLSIEKQLKSQQCIKKRLMRQKDCLKNYQLFNLIGRGAFGEVRLARNKSTNEIVAIKRMEKLRLVQKKQISSAYVQRQLMIKNNDSKYLVKLHSTFQDRDHLYLVMEYISGGDLLHLLIEKDIFTEEQTKFYVAEIIAALEEIHSRHFIHRDIKPDNILIDKNGHIKISDFGLSKYMSDDAAPKEKLPPQRNSVNKKPTKSYKSFKKHHQCLERLEMIRERAGRTFSKVGTPDYISPEVLTSESYDYSIDIWSVGVIMFQCLFGYPPFSDQDPKEVCKRVVNWIDILEFPSDIEVSFQAKLLILGMINQREKRLSIKQIKQHPFFNGVDWEKLSQYKSPMIPNLSNEIDTRNFQRYEQSTQWTFEISDQEQHQNLNEQKQQVQNLQKCPSKNMFIKKRSTSADYLFAGFQYKSVSMEPFKTIQNQISKSKNKKLQKIHQVRKQLKKSVEIPIKSIKRYHTEENNHLRGSLKASQKGRSEKYIINMPVRQKNLIPKVNETTSTFLQYSSNSKIIDELSCSKENQKKFLKKCTNFNSNRKILPCQKNKSNKII